MMDGRIKTVILVGLIAFLTEFILVYINCTT